MGNLNLENMKFKIPLSLETSESTRDLGIDVNVHAGKMYDSTIEPCIICVLVEMFILGALYLILPLVDSLTW